MDTGHKAAPLTRVDKHWGYEIIWAHTGDYVGKLLHIDAGQALSYQYHEKKDETIYVVNGTLHLHVSSDDSPPSVVELAQGQAFHITPRLRHRFEARQEVDLMEVSTPFLEDVVRLEDRYGRAGK